MPLFIELTSVIGVTQSPPAYLTLDLHTHFWNPGNPAWWVAAKRQLSCPRVSR